MKLEKSTGTILVDYGESNLKSLILTNDKKEYERLKAQDNIGVLFEPEPFGIETDSPIYLVGIQKDK